MNLYSIGNITKQLKLSADTLRYYEKFGLLPNIARANSGNRQYSDKDISRLKFIKRAQRMNYSLEEIKNLLKMREDPQHAKNEIRSMTAEKLADIETHLQDLTTLKNELTLLLNLCRGSKDGCPIIEDLNMDN